MNLLRPRHIAHRPRLKKLVAPLIITLLLAWLVPATQIHAATISVSTIADDLTNNGNCSLREAIQAANTDSAVDACPAGNGADTILLPGGTPNVPAIFTLSITNPSALDENQNQTGDLDILGTLTIIGGDANTTEINGGSIDRVIDIQPGAAVTLAGMSISHGQSAQNGGAIYNSGTLTLNGVTIYSNHTDGDGGGIFNANPNGAVTANESTIRNNSANGNGGGVANNAGSVTLNSCTINDNSVGNNGGGIANNAVLVVNSCWIHDNQPVTGNGAGIHNTRTATISNSNISENYANLNGGNIYSGDSNELSSLTISNSQVTHGFAKNGNNGGGIYNDGALNLTNVTINTNRAALGDGIYNVEATQPMTLTNVTLAYNTEPPESAGEGIRNAGAALILKNTLVAFNGPIGDCSGPITSLGNNLEYSPAPSAGNTCSLSAPAGDLIGVDPLLGPFQNNGGKTATYALLDLSPAINAGTDTGCPSTDQRGVSRPRGPHCDIGAYEKNNAPVALADTYSTNEDTPLVVDLPGLLANDSDFEGDALTTTLVMGPSHGALTLGAKGSFTYTPSANYHGVDSFSYQVSDGASTSATTPVTLTVNSVNDAPEATADAYSTDEDTPLIVDAPGVLGNDIDPDGDVLTAILVLGPSHGALTLGANGSFTYTPSANYHGMDSFSYQVNDGVAASTAKTVSLTVNSVNDPPIANGDTAGTTVDSLLIIPVAFLLSNDSDVDGDPLGISGVRASSARGGVATLAEGTVRYAPPAHFKGIDSFTYTVSDGQGGTATGTVTITVGIRRLYLPLARR